MTAPCAPCDEDSRRLAVSCVHAWRIETPDGPTSVGVCRRCGAEREFGNVYWSDLEGRNALRQHPPDSDLSAVKVDLRTVKRNGKGKHAR